MTIKELYYRLLTQINIITNDFFLKDVVEKSFEVQQLATEGFLVLEELDSVMNSWRDETFLLAKKETDLLFTDEQLAAVSAAKKNLKIKEKRIDQLHEALVDIDNRRQNLEKELAHVDDLDLGSQQLSLVSQHFWLELNFWRLNNLEERRQALVNLVEKLKTENQSSLTKLNPVTNMKVNV